MSAGDFSIFLTRPITVVLLGLCVLVLLSSALNLAPKQLRGATTD
jgi:TctA family transporter